MMLIRRHAEPLALAAKLKVLQLVGFAIYSFQKPNHRDEMGETRRTGSAEGTSLPFRCTR